MPAGRFVWLVAPFCICRILLISPAALGDYAREVLKDKPVAWWRFADKTTADGAAAKDETGQNPGVYRGGVTLEAGPAAIGRRAVRFNIQVVDGPYRGSVTEAIADPWLERRGGFEWRGSPYTSELVSDLMLQLMDMGLVKYPR